MQLHATHCVNRVILLRLQVHQQRQVKMFNYSSNLKYQYFFIPIKVIYTSCSPSPCQNGGTCILFNGVATCLCPDNYNGTYCQTSLLFPLYCIYILK